MILDTHVWLRYLGGVSLAKRALRGVEQARLLGRLQVAAVTLWEVALLVHERKLRVDGATGEWLAAALLRSGATVAPLEPGVAQECARLISVLRDPADCQIAGTALHMGVPLVTRDARILENARSLGLNVVEG
jgi:PIN domain nuclease of toxin-antitoxin system